MTVSHIKPLLAERAAAAHANRTHAGEGYAAVAAKVAPVEPDVAPASTPAPSPASTSTNADGLAAMRLALARMGATSSDAPAPAVPASTAPKAEVVDAGAQAGEADAGNATRLPPLTGRDLQDMLKMQSTSFDPSLYERLGAHYNDYVNAYGAGGYYYDPAAITLAGMSDAQIDKLKTDYASPQAWLHKHGWYDNAVAAAPSSWDEVQRARLA